MIACKKHAPFQTLLAVRTFFGLMVVVWPLSVFAVAPSITVQPVGQTVGVGTPVTVGVSAVGDPALGYQWWKNGAALVGATNATLSIADARMTDSGVYRLVTTNAEGVALSFPADVAVGFPSLLAWGNNSCAQLGDGTTATANRPICVATNVVTAAVGGGHSLFVKADGTLWTMGGGGGHKR